MYRTPGTAPDAPYVLWLTETARAFNVSIDASFSSDLWGLAEHVITAYPPSPIAGYILCSLSDGSVNAAIALGTVLGGIAVTEDNAARAKALHLPALADVRGRSLEWVLAALGPGNFSSRVTLIQDPQKTGMADVAIAMRALAWYPAKSADEPLAQRVWGSLSPPFVALGWGPDEKTTVATASAHGGAVLASDWASNLDVLSAFDLPAFSSPPAAAAAAAPAAPGVHTAAFLMSDGDNAQFILGPFAQDQAHFGSPDRGKVPMGWTLPPALVELAPVALRYFYAHASGADDFVGGVSGAAYYYPDVAAAQAGPAAAASLVNLSQSYLASAGFRTLNILASADGLLSKDIAAAFLQAPTLDAIFHYPYSDYAGDHGAVEFVGGKPVIGGRFCLWGDGSGPNKDLKNVTQAAQALVGASRDATSAGGYSLIRACALCLRCV